MLVGYPLWWLIGIADIVPLIAAAVMAVELLKMRRVTVQPGFGWWLLFLAWVAVGVLLLQVDAPNAVPDHSSTRYVTFAFRLGWYLTATITLIYIYNMRSRLSTIRILRAFSWLFVTVVVGGVIGTVAPTIDFPSLLELVLPHRLSHIQYVHDLVHPVMAQRYAVSGVVHPRASAPFAYTNDWGLNYACLLPFFVLGWLRRDAGWRRRVAPIILLVSIYPVVMTQNRGMWVALVISAVLITVRSWLFGRTKPLVGLVALTAVLAAILLATPLGHTLETRLANGYSNSGRTSLGELTVDSVLRKAPVVGLGSTRNVQGSFYSIAGGDTATCSLCTPPALGTQGHFWLVIFSTGLGGLALYLGFIALQLFRSARRNSAMATLALSVLATHLATMFVYDTIGVALVTIFAAIGLLWRDTLDEPGRTATGERRAAGRRDRDVGAYGSVLRTNAIAVIVCAGLGASIGLAFAHSRPPQYSAQTSIAIPVETSYPGVANLSQSLDTVAALIGATPVRKAIAVAAGEPADSANKRVTVTATPNSQVLHIQYTDSDPARARRVSAAAARALDQQRVRLARNIRILVVQPLVVQTAALELALQRIADLPSSGTSQGSALDNTRQQLEDQLISIAITIGQITGNPVAPATITENPKVVAASGTALVATCSGFVIGLLVAIVLAFLRDAVGPRVGRRSRTPAIGRLWVLARLPAGVTRRHGLSQTDSSEQLADVVDLLAWLRASLVISIDGDVATRAVSGYLNDALGRPECDKHAAVNRVVLLAGPRTRLRHIAERRKDLEHRGASICGLVLSDQHIYRATADEPRTARTPAMQRD